MGSRDELLAACETMRELVSDYTELDEKIDGLNEELQVVSELVTQCVKENACTAQSQEEYSKKYTSLVRRYEKAQTALQKATEERRAKNERDQELRAFIGTLKEKPLVVEEWSEDLWVTLLDTATVHKDGRIVFLFKNGTSIEVQA